MDNPGDDQSILLVDEFSDGEPLMTVSRNCAVRLDATSLSAAVKEILRFSSRIVFVDPFYDPFNGRYKKHLSSVP